MKLFRRIRKSSEASRSDTPAATETVTEQADATPPTEELAQPLASPLAESSAAVHTEASDAPSMTADARLADSMAQQIPAQPAPSEDVVPEGSPVAGSAPASVPAESKPDVSEPAPAKTGFYARLKRGLSRTGNQLAAGLGNLFLGKKVIDDELLEELESQLLMSDIGIEATQRVIDDITARVSRKELADGEAVMGATQSALLDIIEPCQEPLSLEGHSPFVILVVGVNGAGKTTTIGKMASRFKAEGRKVMLAAGDTFRAAAVEQLQAWGERHDVPVIAQHTGADSASVLFDALQAAKARGVDVLIADTAGRLQNKAHLMEELEKVVRVMRKIDPTAPHETLLVLDAGTGQNAVSQAETFDKSVGVSGIVLTKLDGTARGGVIFAIAQRLRRPIRFIGVGESAEDLRPFDAKSFVQALFDRSEG